MTYHKGKGTTIVEHMPIVRQLLSDTDHSYVLQNTDIV